MGKSPLAGVRVLEFTVVIGAPYGTMLLADMGAEVIRVESTQHFPPMTRGDRARPPKALLPYLTFTGRSYPDGEPGERPWNRVALFNCHARNKKSFTVDLARPEGREIVRRLVRVADAVVENNAPGTMAKLGLDYATLRRERPDLVMVSVSGMGQTGPYRDLRGFGVHFEDLAGHHWLRAYADGDPAGARGGIVPSDSAGGTGLVIALVAALHHRNRSGEGQYIDLSMAENFMAYLGPTFLDYTMNGRVQASIGNGSPFGFFQGVYPCAGPLDEDAWVALTLTSDAEWASLCALLGRPDLAADPRFATGEARFRNALALQPLIAAWTRERTATEAAEALQRAGIAAGRTMNEATLYHDPHLEARGFFQRITHPDAGTHRYPVRLYGASATPTEVHQPPVTLGEHNEYIYRELLGLRDAEYRELEAAGHIGTEYVPHIS